MTKPRRSSTRSRSRATSPSSSRSLATLDWTSGLGTLVGYAIAGLILVLPIVVLLLVMRTRWFERRKRLRWASRDFPLVRFRGTMDNLPPPFNEDPHEVKRRRD